ncbi:MAG TPA: PEGA domain-containing protein [Phycisphaerales bacterium]|nr:PEGA domain-containing protein [Phycisphaerales bacterium]
MRPALLALTLVAVATLTGCVERRLSVTSDPPGALVYINDLEVGRTPLQTSFLFHGWYDVRVELEGYEPLRTEAEAAAPVYEYPPIDLVAEALPMKIRNTQRWHFVLSPLAEAALTGEEAEGLLAERARAMRAELAATPRPKASALPAPREEFEEPGADDGVPTDKAMDGDFPLDDDG